MQIQEDKPYDDINITPMLDLAYVLLVIFILMCTASVQGIKVNLPHASNAPSKPLTEPKTQAITVNNQGGYALNTTPMTLPEIQQHLATLKASYPDLPVVIRGDSKTPYQAIMDALAMVGNLGISEVGLATKPANQK
jgi:biopolymer transport protein ExbD